MNRLLTSFVLGLAAAGSAMAAPIYTQDFEGVALGGGNTPAG